MVLLRSPRQQIRSRICFSAPPTIPCPAVCPISCPRMHWYQMNNEDQISVFRSMAEKIWIRADGLNDAFVQNVGTAAVFAVQAEHYGGISFRKFPPTTPPGNRTPSASGLTPRELSR